LPGAVEELQGIIRDEGHTTARGVLPGALKRDCPKSKPCGSGQKPVGDVVAHAKRGRLVAEAERNDHSTGALPRFSLKPEAPYVHPFYWACLS
jgi:hypothetical protein